MTAQEGFPSLATVDRFTFGGIKLRMLFEGGGVVGQRGKSKGEEAKPEALKLKIRSHFLESILSMHLLVNGSRETVDKKRTKARL